LTFWHFASPNVLNFSPENNRFEDPATAPVFEELAAFSREIDRLRLRLRLWPGLGLFSGSMILAIRRNGWRGAAVVTAGGANELTRLNEEITLPIPLSSLSFPFPFEILVFAPSGDI
jgi:hypothetical protein